MNGSDPPSINQLVWQIPIDGAHRKSCLGRCGRDMPIRVWYQVGHGTQGHSADELKFEGPKLDPLAARFYTQRAVVCGSNLRVSA